MYSRWLILIPCALLAACEPAAAGESTDLFADAGLSESDEPSSTGGSPNPGDGTNSSGAGATGGAGGGNASGPDLGEADASAGDTGGGTPLSLAGRFEGCSSYGAEADGLCGGYYCNVTEDEIMAAFTPGLGPCGMNPDIEGTVRRACSGSLTARVGRCAREVKSANVLDSDAQLRVKIQACIYEDAEFTEVPAECLSCFLDAAQCASDHCLIQCLAGDSAACDTCRLENGCNQPVPTCAGLPNPF